MIITEFHLRKLIRQLTTDESYVVRGSIATNKDLLVLDLQVK
jgi:hypothetical protein